LNSLAILIDFGSTYTKVIAVDLDRAEVIGRSQAPSSVLTDVRDGLLQALCSLHERHGIFASAPRDLTILENATVLASSSAAGGLKIVVVGNVPGLTVEAANQAALGAGAKLIGSTAFKLSDAKLREVEALAPDMILLTGGTDGGDEATILHNAGMLAAAMRLAVPIVVAGNRAASAAVAALLQGRGKEVRLAENVMPRTSTVAVEGAREEIRKLFMERITHAKGLDALAGTVPVVLPTPMAVLRGVRLGADGTGVEPGWGDMLVVDVGGATTDVHSIGYGLPGGESAIVQGLAEPYAKRTVEGDLGIRFNAATIVERIGLEKLSDELRANFKLRIDSSALSSYIEQIGRKTATVPQRDWHAAADAVLARNAVALAIARHVGRRERIVAREGEAWVHYGKDLRETRTLIGIGGIFVHNPNAAYILSPREQADDRVQTLQPRNPAAYLDASYLLYAVGLLSESRPDVALPLFKRYITPIKSS